MDIQLNYTARICRGLNLGIMENRGEVTEEGIIMHPKAQHYVPRFYLRNFANKRKKGYFIFCFDKLTGKTFKPNIKNVANQTAFYDFPSEDGKKVSLEEPLQNLEAKSSVAIQSLISDPTYITLLTNKEVFAYFIAVQEIRTLVFRNKLDEYTNAINAKINSSNFKMPLLSEVEKKEYQAGFLIEKVSMLVDVLLNMKWLLVMNKTETPFWTSDNPVFRHNPYRSKFIGTTGLLCKGIQVQLPITPSLAIAVCDPSEYAHISEQLTTNLSNVQFYNSYQVVASGRYLFSISDNFDLAHEMIPHSAPLSGEKGNYRISLGHERRTTI